LVFYTSQQIGWEDPSEMIYRVSSRMLNLPYAIQPYHAVHKHGTILEFLLNLFVINCMLYS